MRMVAGMVARLRARHAVLAVAAGLLLWGLAAILFRERDDPFSDRLVDVVIGEYGYRVPRNYILAVRNDDTARMYPARAIMRALWPGLEPLTPETAHLWERRIPERQITFHIETAPRSHANELKGAIEVGGVGPDPVAAPYGLLKYEKGLRRFFVSADPAYRTPTGDPLVLKCDDLPESTYRTFQVELTCQAFYDLGDGSKLYYRFFMVNLAQWREIDTEIRALVESFRN